MADIMPKIGEVYDFRSGTRLVTSEPQLDLDGVLKVQVAYVRVYYYPIPGSPHANHIQVDPATGEVQAGSSENWANVSSITHQWVFIEDKVYQLEFDPANWPGRVEYHRPVKRVFLKSKRKEAQ